MPFAAAGMMKIAWTREWGGVFDSAEVAVGSEAVQQWCFKPAGQSGPDVDTNPGLLPPAVGEHAEQNV